MTLNKIAFLIHEPVMLDHYAGVWKAMGSSRFAIVLTDHFASDLNGNEKPGVPEFLDYVRMEGYEVKPIKEIIASGIKFKYVVTNHIISGSSKEIVPGTIIDYFKKMVNRALLSFSRNPLWDYNTDIYTYLPLQVGIKQIRFMYGADISDAWSLQNWNDIYDLFLCHGVNDESIIRQHFKGKTVIMGYPRYDRFFSGGIDLSNIKREFSISQSKKTLLWMPTLGGEYSSIPIYSKPLSELSGHFNIIVRPHPLSFSQEKEFIAELENCNLLIDRRATRDMNEMFSLADLVLADYGGTPFSAIFLGKNLVFLDVPGGDYSPINIGSSVLALKEVLPTMTPANIGDLNALLESEDFLTGNSKAVEYLFAKYFNSPRGNGSLRVADYLKRVDI